MTYITKNTTNLSHKVTVVRWYRSYSDLRVMYVLFIRERKQNLTLSQSPSAFKSLFEQNTCN